jgi:hypothetical protein
MPIPSSAFRIRKNGLPADAARVLAALPAGDARINRIEYYLYNPRTKLSAFVAKKSRTRGPRNRVTVTLGKRVPSETSEYDSGARFRGPGGDTRRGRPPPARPGTRAPTETPAIFSAEIYWQTPRGSLPLMATRPEMLSRPMLSLSHSASQEGSPVFSTTVKSPPTEAREPRACRLTSLGLR